MRGIATLALSMALLCTWPVAAGASDELPEPPAVRTDAHGRYLSPYLANDTLAPWVGTVMARKLDIDFGALAAGAGVAAAGVITGPDDLALFLSSERPPGLDAEFAAFTRGLEDGGAAGARLAEVLGNLAAGEIISRLGAEITSTAATEAFSLAAGEVGGLSSMLGPIAALAAGAAQAASRPKVHVDIDALRGQADRSFDRLDDMLVHTVVHYRHREDFEYAIEAALLTYPDARSRIRDAMRDAGEIIHAEVRRMGGAGSMDIEWVSGDE